MEKVWHPWDFTPMGQILSAYNRYLLQSLLTVKKLFWNCMQNDGKLKVTVVRPRQCVDDGHRSSERGGQHEPKEWSSDATISGPCPLSSGLCGLPPLPAAQRHLPPGSVQGLHSVPVRRWPHHSGWAHEYWWKVSTCSPTPPSRTGCSSVGRMLEFQVQFWYGCDSLVQAAREFCPRVNLQCRLAYIVCTAPLCSRINMCTSVKNPKCWQPYHCLDTHKYCTHS